MTNERARALRRNQTNAELKLWRDIRRRQLRGNKFRRQHPIGNYIVDFVCLEKKLIIELDGEQHASGRQKTHDESRDAWLETRGYRVIRYWNEEIYSNIDGVLTEIEIYLSDPHYGPPPS